MNQHASPASPGASGGPHWVDQFLPANGNAPRQGSGPVNASFMRGVAFRQRFLIAGTIALALLAGLLITLLMTPVYEATSTVRIEPYATNIVEGQDQSLVDYPLRNQTMLVVAAFALALLLRSSCEEEQV